MYFITHLGHFALSVFFIINISSDKFEFMYFFFIIGLKMCYSNGYTRMN